MGFYALTAEGTLAVSRLTESSLSSHSQVLMFSSLPPSTLSDLLWEEEGSSPFRR